MDVASVFAKFISLMTIIKSMNLTGEASMSYRKYVMVYPQAGQSCPHTPVFPCPNASWQSFASALGFEAMASIR
jgi:hypothetical protein